MTSTESTVVFTDRVVRLTAVQTVSQDDWRATVELCGEFDIANADDIRRELAAHVDAGRRVLRIETSGVAFMDSTAIGVLVSIGQRCREDQGSLILTGVRRPLQRLLDVAGLESVLLVDTAERPEPHASAAD